MASAAWERRNARARALGYRNYYDYRAHHYGQRPASQPAARGPSLRRLRGHAGRADAAALLGAGKVDMVNVVQTEYDPPEMEVNMMLTNGKTRVFRLRGQQAIDDFESDIEDLGADAPMMVGSPKALAAMRGA